MVAPDSWTWGDVESDVVPRTATVDLCLNGTVQARIEAAQARLKAARKSDTLDADSSDAQADLDALETEAEAATRTFTIEACGHRRWRELLVEHRSDEPGERYDAETFIPAAIAECCPQFSDAAQVAQAADKLTTAQIAKLFGAVRQVNEGDDQAPLTRGR